MIVVNDTPFSLKSIEQVVYEQKPIALDQETNFRSKINQNNDFLETSVASGVPIYGTTTGFGASCNQFVGSNHAKALQKNLIRYHQCGVGEPFSNDQAIAIMICRLVSLAKGYSGVRYTLLETLTHVIQNRIIPFIPQMGSVGASGDLTPLAYIASVLEGTGRVIVNNEIVSAQKILYQYNISPVEFSAKEGLAIINGTSVMTGVLALTLGKIKKLCNVAEKITAICVQALHGKKEAFDCRIHQLKPFQGQKVAAQQIRQNLENSHLITDYRQQAQENMVEKSKQKLSFAIQNVYSLRCSPHIIGVVRDTLDIAYKWAEIELNSVTDNPLIFDRDEAVLLGGNFYGGYIAQAADSLKIAVSHLADLADKQLALLVDEKFSQGLPANLVIKDIGLNHGFKGLQITVSALTAEILRNTTPASIFSRTTESSNQDKVSMGTIATRDLENIVNLTTSVLAILSLAAVQAMDIKGKENFSPNSQQFYEKIRSESAVLEEDRPMDTDIQKVSRLLLMEE